MDKDIITTDAELELLAKAFTAKGKSHYPREYKEKIVKKVLVDQESVTEISRAVDIPRQTIYQWILNFSGEGKSKKKDTIVSKSNQHSMPMPKQSQNSQNPPETPEEELVRLRAENKRLENALKMSELASHAKDVMIDIAEKTFNIPIRKKSGAKQ